MGAAFFIFGQDKLRNSFYTFSQPVYHFFDGIGKSASGFFQSVFQREKFLSENEILREKVQYLEEKLISLKLLQDENQQLKSALGVELNKNFKLKMATISGKDLNSDSIIINLGFSDGIAKDMIAVTGNKVLIGKISEVHQDYSRISLLTNSKDSFDAKTLDGQIGGVIRGKGRGQIEFDLISEDVSLAVGSLVITSSLGLIYPEGLIVGSVSEIGKSESGSFKKATISPYFDVVQANTIFIIAP